MPTLPNRVNHPAIRSKALNERTEIEPFLRDIIVDPTETAHGPTEIADIITHHLHVNGRLAFAAFVNKGRATRKVSSAKIAHQLLRARSLAGLDLLVLVATGDIQDDVRRDIANIAADMAIDYCILDAIEVARLFISFHKICPEDGRPYHGGVCTSCRRSASRPISVVIPVFQNPGFEVISHRDISTGILKRYVADIVTNELYPRPVIEEAVVLAADQIKASRHYRNEITRTAFGDRDADEVSLFVYVNPSDIQTASWICRAHWTNGPALSRGQAPRWTGQKVGEVIVDWNRNWEQRNLYVRLDKDMWMPMISELIKPIDSYFNFASQSYKQWQSGSISLAELKSLMADNEPGALSIFFASVFDGVPPLECDDAWRAARRLVSTMHNIYVPFARNGKVERDGRFFEWHLQTYLSQCEEDRAEFTFEWRKIQR